MSGTTAIEWTQASWNPTKGCDRVSPGCDHCYALTMAKRLKGMGQAEYQQDGDPRTSGPGFLAHESPSALDWPLHQAKPLRIFVNSMSDLFHANISDEFIARVFAVMALADRHTFQVLTKRHARMRSLLSSDLFRRQMYDALVSLDYQWINANRLPWPLRNVWLGVSVESQQWADIRIPALLDTPAAVRFLSCEPLLGPVKLAPEWLVPRANLCSYSGTTTEDHAALAQILRAATRRFAAEHGEQPLAFVDWVIAGGESGPGARPMADEWARSLRDQCAAAGVPFMFKQAGSVLAREWGGKGKGGDPADWPETFPREYPA